MAELCEIVGKYAPKTIYFRDENFFHSPKRIYRFIQLYKQNQFTFKWRATCRANYFTNNYINNDLLRKLENINCETLKFGFESGSQRILDYLKKGIKIKNCEHVVHSLSKSSIIGNYSFLIGVPGESREDYVKTLEFIEFITKTDPDAEIIGPQFYRIYPGGELYNEIITTYDLKEPKSFEEWSKVSERDELGFGKNVYYPWIGTGKLLVRYSDIMMLLYRKKFIDLLTIKKFPALLFFILAKIRVRLGIYGSLYDMKVADYLFRKYLQLQRN
jgi:radical SAM superfamily enzyme YgiQ (UPF0313 family)